MIYSCQPCLFWSIKNLYVFPPFNLAHVKFVKGACTQMQSKTKGIAWQPETLEDNINENKRIASFYFCIPKPISNFLVRLH